LLTDQMTEWSVTRSQAQAQASLDSVRGRLCAELRLTVAHRLEADRVIEMVDEGTIENASEKTEETAPVDKEYWGEFRG
jgi:hypothetical protein